jgi:hypothetical protein
MKTIIDCTSNEVINRELNDDELAQQAIDEQNALVMEATAKAEADAKAQAKAALLERLGLTEDEAKLLLA